MDKRTSLANLKPPEAGGLGCPPVFPFAACGAATGWYAGRWRMDNRISIRGRKSRRRPGVWGCPPVFPRRGGAGTTAGTQGGNP